MTNLKNDTALGTSLAGVVRDGATDSRGTTNRATTFLSFKQVQEEHAKRGLPEPAREQLHRRIKAGEFPAPRKYGARAFWVESEVLAALDPDNLPRASYAPAEAGVA